MLCAKFGQNWHWGAGEENLNIFKNILYISSLSPLGKGCGPSFEQTWIPITQCFWRRRFLNVYNIISQILPVKNMTLHLNKLESPPPKDALCLVWLKLVKWFWRRLLFNIFNIFYHFAIISPWKRAWPFIWTNLNALQPRMLYAKFGEKWPSGSGEEIWIWEKFTDGQNDKWTDDKQHVIRKAHLSFQLRWAKNIFKEVAFL